MYLIEEMTRPEVEARIKEYPVAILPVGSCEQHGPHLPLGTDTILARELAGRVSQKTGALVYPSLNFGYAWVWRDIAGTLTMPPERLQQLLCDCAASAQRSGIKVLVFLNGHEANSASIKYAVRAGQDEVTTKLLGMFYPGLSAVYDKEMESPTWGGMFHACEFETSLMLAVAPQLVKMNLARAEYPERPPLYGYDDTSIGALSQSGVYGDPTKATAEKGRRMLEAFTDNAAQLIEAALASLG